MKKKRLQSLRVELQPIMTELALSGVANGPSSVFSQVLSGHLQGLIRLRLMSHELLVQNQLIDQIESEGYEYD